jgi:hypothetical protein
MANSRKKEFKHDFSGSCKPEEIQKSFSNWKPATFSVGIFQWLPYAAGKRKGLKKSVVKYRVKGFTSNPEPVYKRAREICDELDRKFPDVLMWMIYKKSETVRNK